MSIGETSIGNAFIATGSGGFRGLGFCFHGIVLVSTGPCDESLSFSNRNFLCDAVLHYLYTSQTGRALFLLEL